MNSQQNNDEWQKRTDYAEVMYRRATGALPEMESSKAIAMLLAAEVQNGDSILDVGCGAGHYLRSLQQRIPLPFTYTGVDATELFIDMAQRAWQHQSHCNFLVDDIYNLSFPDQAFDIVMCNNVLYNIPSIVQPVRELMRVARRMVVIRTLIGDHSFYIKEVYSKANRPYSHVPVEHEFADNGEPVTYGHHNIHSRGYFEGVVRRARSDVTVEFIEDRYFDAAAIDRSAASEGVVGPTKMLDGLQIFGKYIIQPWSFVQIQLAAKTHPGLNA